MNHYQFLGLAKNASKNEIKEAYKILALIYHPDKHSSSSQKVIDVATRRFRQVSEAYAVLGDDRKRADYNNSFRSTSASSSNSSYGTGGGCGGCGSTSSSSYGSTGGSGSTSSSSYGSTGGSGSTSSSSYGSSGGGGGGGGAYGYTSGSNTYYEPPKHTAKGSFKGRKWTFEGDVLPVCFCIVYVGSKFSLESPLASLLLTHV
ncbi:hypothetical protein MKW94_028244 [Papaver nudicaule]|uniref:J domain-containing protein n=1 Tax=Papaver nudicaule TaxID=74823 RepID=A0AA41VEX9_PAPNU|nr:hypothetical protein [Papaver nudicaule]